MNTGVAPDAPSLMCLNFDLKNLICWEISRITWDFSRIPLKFEEEKYLMWGKKLRYISNLRINLRLFVNTAPGVVSKRHRSLWMDLMKHNACRRRLLFLKRGSLWKSLQVVLLMGFTFVQEVMPLRSSSQPPQSLNFGKTSSTFCLNTTGSDDFMSYYFSHPGRH